MVRRYGAVPAGVPVAEDNLCCAIVVAKHTRGVAIYTSAPTPCTAMGDYVIPVQSLMWLPLYGNTTELQCSFLNATLIRERLAVGKDLHMCQLHARHVRSANEYVARILKAPPESLDASDYFARPPKSVQFDGAAAASSTVNDNNDAGSAPDMLQALADYAVADQAAAAGSPPHVRGTRIRSFQSAY